MRKFLISLLLAGAAATPALAAPHRSSDRDSAREERQQAREDRQSAREEKQSAREERSERSNNAEQPQNNRPDRAQQVDVRQRSFQAPAQAGGRADARDIRALADQRRDSRNDARTQRIDQRQQVVDQRREDIRDRRDLRQSARPAPPVMHTRPPVVSNTPRPGTQPPLRTEHRRGGDHHWDGNWRHDRRYDWNNYRHHHRSLFRLGFYFDPYGWGYQPFSIGWRLWPSYYSSRYWINDPWMYRLPYAPPGYVWVRYWNDALLVDTWSGTVVDVIPSFFW